MDREKYNACMSPYIRGKEKTKEERRLGFCIGAKVCSGKAKTEEEARTLCNAPRLPKWAAEKQGEENLTCPQRIDRSLKTILEVRDMIKSGETSKVKDSLAVILQDVHACAPEEVVRLANDALNDVKKTSADYYFAGEGREMIKDLDMLSGLLKEPNG
ncbi:MAG: hypothetical protein PHV11_06970 [Candidatus Bipolaricaulis sp.]|nr:hypothetical protein [Candidatus Bipolaricaulis sp.]